MMIYDVLVAVGGALPGDMIAVCPRDGVSLVRQLSDAEVRAIVRPGVVRLADDDGMPGTPPASPEVN